MSPVSASYGSSAGNQQARTADVPPEISTRSRLVEVLSMLDSQSIMLRNGIEHAHGPQPEPAGLEKITNPQTHTELLDHIEAVIRMNRDKLEFLIIRL